MVLEAGKHNTITRLMIGSLSQWLLFRHGTAAYLGAAAAVQLPDKGCTMHLSAHPLCRMHHQQHLQQVDLSQQHSYEQRGENLVL